MAGSFQRGRRHGRDAGVWKAQELLKDAGHGEQATRIGDAFEIMLPLLGQVIRLNQDRPGTRRQVVAKMAGVSDMRSSGSTIGCRARPFERGAGHFYVW